MWCRHAMARKAASPGRRPSGQDAGAPRNPCQSSRAGPACGNSPPLLSGYECSLLRAPADGEMVLARGLVFPELGYSAATASRSAEGSQDLCRLPKRTDRSRYPRPATDEPPRGASSRPVARCDGPATYDCRGRHECGPVTDLVLPRRLSDARVAQGARHDAGSTDRREAFRRDGPEVRKQLRSDAPPSARMGKVVPGRGAGRPWPGRK